MDKENLNIGDLVTGKVNEDLESAFTGTVEKVYENSALVTITDFDAVDKANVSELNNKIVVNLKQLKAAKNKIVSKEPFQQLILLKRLFFYSLLSKRPHKFIVD